MQKLESRLYSIIDLFIHEKKYVVPEHQREYSWNEDDVISFLEDMESIIDPDNSADEEYFFGAMVLMNPSKTTSNEGYKIIDGQQRLTTSAIFVAVVRDILYEKNHSSSAKELDSHIIGKDYHTGDTYDRLELGKRNKNTFHTLMKMSKPEDKIKLENVPTSDVELINAYSTIYEKIMNKYNSNDFPRNIISMCEQFLRRFQVILVVVESYAHAYRIFETLNDRGVSLSQGDLVKNYLLSLCKSDHSQDEVLCDWNRMLDILDGLAIDDFLHYFWLSNHSRIKKNEIYKKLAKKIITENDVKKFVTKLIKYAEIYTQILEPEKEYFWGNVEIVDILKNLKTLNSKVCYIVILLAKYKLEEYEFKNICNMCLNFFFRYKTICGRHATALEVIMVSVAKKLRNDSDVLDIQKIFLDPINYPEKSDFISAFEKISVSDKIGKYILQKITLSKNENRLREIDSIHIEHIMPKTIKNTRWEQYLTSKGIDDLQAYHEQWCKRLGNMTLMIKLSNEDRKKLYDIKYRNYYRHSLIEITNTLPESSEWYIDQIKTRQHNFAELSENIWKIE